jgi:hypothetical protein
VSRKTSSAIAALLCITIAAPAFAKPQCYTHQDVRAMQVRQLHYELMVAALKCQGGEVDFHDKWSSWVNRFGSVMNSNANQLRGLFSRLGKGQSGMDRYVTQLSNDASMRAQHVEDYCGTQAKLFDTVLALSPTEMEAWAVDSIEKPMPATANCSATSPSPVKQAKVTAPAPTKAKVEKTKADKPKATRTADAKG